MEWYNIENHSRLLLFERGMEAYGEGHPRL